MGWAKSTEHALWSWVTAVEHFGEISPFMQTSPLCYRHGHGLGLDCSNTWGKELGSTLCPCTAGRLTEWRCSCLENSVRQTDKSHHITIQPWVRYLTSLWLDFLPRKQGTKWACTLGWESFLHACLAHSRHHMSISSSTSHLRSRPSWAFVLWPEVLLNAPAASSS